MFILDLECFVEQSLVLLKVRIVFDPKHSDCEKPEQIGIAWEL